MSDFAEFQIEHAKDGITNSGIFGRNIMHKAVSKLKEGEKALLGDVQSIREQMRSLPDFMVNKLAHDIITYEGKFLSNYRLSFSIEKDLNIPMLSSIFEMDREYCWEVKHEFLCLLEREILTIQKDQNFWNNLWGISVMAKRGGKRGVKS